MRKGSWLAAQSSQPTETTEPTESKILTIPKILNQPSRKMEKKYRSETISKTTTASRLPIWINLWSTHLSKRKCSRKVGFLKKSRKKSSYSQKWFISPEWRMLKEVKGDWCRMLHCIQRWILMPEWIEIRNYWAILRLATIRSSRSQENMKLCPVQYWLPRQCSYQTPRSIRTTVICELAARYCLQPLSVIGSSSTQRNHVRIRINGSNSMETSYNHPKDMALKFKNQAFVFQTETWNHF